MTPPSYTRCPGCATVFRVSAAQLALREGQVRCGHCRAVFDANDHQLTLDVPRADDFEMPDELAAGRPTVTLRSADALQPVAKGEVKRTSDAKSSNREAAATPAGENAAAAGEAATPTGIPLDERSGATPGAAGENATTTPAPGEAIPDANAGDDDLGSADASTSSVRTATDSDTADVDDIDLRPVRREWQPRKPLRERPQTMYGVAMTLLAVALVVQAVVDYRETLAAHAPFTRPLLAGACALFGCTVGPVRDAGALSIEASDLQADPAHRGHLKFTATIRNRASYPIARPYLELALTDSSDVVVASRAFAPSEYVRAGDAAHGIPGNGEDLVTLFLDASQTSQAGYRLYLFYP